MRITKKTICVAKGKVYCEIALHDMPSSSVSLFARGCKGDVAYPAELYSVDGSDTLAGIYVVTVPNLGVGSIDICIECRDGEGHFLDERKFGINFKVVRAQSIFAFRLKAEHAAKIIAVDEAPQHDSYQMRVLRFLEGESGKAIWRIDATWRGDVAEQPRIEVFDRYGSNIDTKLYFFEGQELAIDGMDVRRNIYSLEVPYDLTNFYAVASSDSGLVDDGFCAVDGRFSHNKRVQTAEFMQDACFSEEAYRTWLKAHRATNETLVSQRESAAAILKRGDAPLFSIVVPCFESKYEFLSEMVASVESQSYSNWELILIDVSSETGVVMRCIEELADKRIKYHVLDENRGIVGNTNYGIEQAQGDWIAFLDHDDLLEPDALYCYVQTCMDDPKIDALFCDEDTFEVAGEFRYPVFKSELNQDLLYSYNCVTHFLAVKREALDEIGLSLDDVSGAQDYDLTLRLVGAGKKIGHVPRMLYHWRQHADSTAGDNVESKPYAQTAGRIALQRHFDHRGIAGRVEDTKHPFVYRMRYATPISHPLVSVVIPNKDHIEELDACIRSILTRSTYREFEIVVVENNSEDARTFEYYERIQGEFSQVRVCVWEGVFNYSAIINFGVEQAEGSRLLLLNNDTEVISEDFIPEMLGYVERPEVGVVGAKLYFRDGLVQHAGIEVGPFDVIVHVNQDFTCEREGYRGRATRPGNFSAVTGACQMVRRDVFEEIGGYDEAFAVGFNDADFCMRAYQAGYLTVFTPYAELYHYEFTSRGRETADSAKLERWERERDLFQTRWSDYFTEGDPFSNPNLSLKSAYYALPE